MITRKTRSPTCWRTFARCNAQNQENFSGIYGAAWGVGGEVGRGVIITIIGRQAFANKKDKNRVASEKKAQTYRRFQIQHKSISLHIEYSTACHCFRICLNIS